MAASEERDSWVDVLGGFPRHLVHSLVEDREERLRARRTAGAWVLGAALAAFALAAPIETLAGRGPALVRAALASELSTSPLLLLGCRSLGPAVGIERAAFLFAALAGGLTVPALCHLARRFGFRGELVLPATLVVVLAPGALLAARLPGPEAPSLLAATLLLAALFPPREGAAPAGSRRIGLPLGLALAVDLGTLWLVPATLWAAASSGRRAALGALGIALAVPAALWAMTAAFGASLSAGGAAALATDALLGTSFPPEGAPLTAVLLDGPLALGPALLGLAALAFVRRGEEESSPPRFLLAWTFLPLLACTSPRPAPIAPLALLPLALVGLLDLLSRLPEPRGLRLALGLAALSFLLAAGGGILLERSDPLATWRGTAERELVPGDLVVSADPARRYVLSARYGLETASPREAGLLEAARSALAAGRRVVVDPAGAEERDLPWLERLEALGAVCLRTP